MATTRSSCGTLRVEDIGQAVTCYGWVDHRRDHGGLVFIDLRDFSGLIQLVINPSEARDAYEAIKDARLEWVLRVDGTVRARGEGQENPRLATGQVELQVTAVTVLSAARTPPFSVHDDAEVDERVRLSYRYLDLRRPRIQKNLRARSEFVAGLRAAMHKMGFVEIETPTLIRATPEGARDYLVPSRLSHGDFYALPQSPQLYKQLCMVGGLDRYFQIARCWRDEDLRADRQPEFTQLDLEMSFVDEDDVFAACEYALGHAWEAACFRGGKLPSAFPRISWEDAQRRYGTDKPDTRFGMELVDLTSVFGKSSFRIFQQAVASAGSIVAICLEGGGTLTRSEIERELAPVAVAGGATGLAFITRRQTGWEGPIAKFLAPSELAKVEQMTGARAGDLVLIAAGNSASTRAGMGALRIYLGRTRSLFDPGQMDILWVTEFPMFEKDPATGEIRAAHHPFTMIREEDIDYLESDPLRVRSRSYDIVLNGRETASGSIRITDPALQGRVFSALGIPPEEAARKFGFLLDAFSFGAPPHGGCAPGIDRLVMEGLGEENIRDVIAFPKNQQAQEPMTGAPAAVSESQLAELGLALLPRRGQKG